MRRCSNRRLAEMVETITRTHDVLSRQRDLSPRNETVNRLLGELVRYVTLPHNRELSRRALAQLDKSGVSGRLRKLCQRAEYELEAYYSQPSRILRFPYVDHYLELSLIEGELAHLSDSSKVVFVGGGPLPWTPLVLAVIQAARRKDKVEQLRGCLAEGADPSHERLNALLSTEFWRNWKSPFQVLAVEREPQAARQAAEALDTLGLTRHVPVIACDGAEMVVPPGFDTVFIASMVDDKARVMLNVIAQLPAGAEVTFLVRSVEPGNLRCLLYEPVDDLLSSMEESVPGLEWVDSFLPPAGSRLINSVHVYKYRKPAPAVATARPRRLHGRSGRKRAGYSKTSRS